MPPELTDTQNLTETATNEANAPDATVLGGAATPDAPAPADPQVDAPADGDAPAAPEAPVIPETYELTLPEGMDAVDTEVLEAATPVFKELGLTNETASKLLPAAKMLVERARDATIEQLTNAGNAHKAELLASAKADPEIGGDKWQQSTVNALKGLEAMGFAEGHPFRQRLNETGFGNDPDMIRTFAAIGVKYGEGGQFVRGDGVSGNVDVKAAMYPNDVKG